MELESRLLEAFADAHPAELARALESLSAENAAEVMGELAVDRLAELLLWFAPPSAAHSLELVEEKKAAAALSATRHDISASILRAMGGEPRSRVVELLSPAARKATKEVLRYAQDTAGAVMDPQGFAIAESVSAGDALARLRSAAKHALHYVYVVSEDQKLVGVVNLPELVAARPDQLLGLIAVRPVQSVSARATSKAILAHPAWRRFHALPVVESGGRFVGVLRYASIRKLEERMLDTEIQDHASQTAAALGELYGLGLRGLVEPAAAVVMGSGKAEGGRK
ncbi:MAG: magnesium transporter [Myxococcales bacterium]|nr:magnesium transporter [Myxococcales bacterium]